MQSLCYFDTALPRDFAVRFAGGIHVNVVIWFFAL